MPKAEYADVRSVIFSCEGTVLTAAEKAFFESEKPFGFILFARNIDTPDQVRTLISDLRACVGWSDAPVLVDQEGGRVQRLRAPHWFNAPSFGKIATLYERDNAAGRRAAEITTRLIAADLLSTGFSVNCSPCLDLGLPQTSAVIGDRSFGGDPDQVVALSQVVADTYMACGIMPVIKHIPGHGRGTVDSHLELPVVSASHQDLAASDFGPFKQMRHIPWGMTAHIVYEALDPEYPATQSKRMVEEIIRGEIGFDGLLLTDDLNMQALKGSLADRAQRAISAGVDIVLHCSGKLPEMKEVVGACPALTLDAVRRIEAGASQIKDPVSFDVAGLKNELADLVELN